MKWAGSMTTDYWLTKTPRERAVHHEVCSVEDCEDCAAIQQIEPTLKVKGKSHGIGRGLLVKVRQAVRWTIVWSIICVSVYAARIWAWEHFFPESYYEHQGKHVFAEKKPHDCEFDSVPYGDKHCHYARVLIENENHSVIINWKRIED